MLISKQRTCLGLVAILGLLATQACSSDASSSGNTEGGGTGGKPSSSGGTSATTTGGQSTGQSGSGTGTSGSTSTTGASGSTSTAGGTGGGGNGTGGTTAGGAAASGGSGGGSNAADTFTLQTAGASQVVATAAGRTLYFYQPDTPAAGQTAAKSACTGTCLTHWPLYYGNPVAVPAGLTASDFGSFDRGGGVMQSTYHGWPVYMYDDDKKAGDALGDLEKNTMGKVVWYAIRIPYTAPPKP